MQQHGAAMVIARRRLARWKLSVDGRRIATPGSLLLPVRGRDGPAVLKILRSNSDEHDAWRALLLWRGRGAVRLLRHDTNAQLLERLEQPDALTAMALRGDDDRATRIIAETAGRLHCRGHSALPHLAPRLQVIHSYRNRLAHGIVGEARGLYGTLFHPGDAGWTLHGDLHHGNIMLAARGPVAIDPKGLHGDRTYDLANTLFNPLPHRALALDRDRMRRRVGILCDTLQLKPQRLLQFAVVHGCAAAAWSAPDQAAERWWLDGAAIAGALLREI